MLNKSPSTSTVSPSNDYSRQPKVEAELIKMLYQQGNTALIGVLATATGIAVVFFNVIPNPIVAGWLATIYCLSFVRFLSFKKYKALANKNINVSFWGRSFAFFTFLSGLVWGSASIILFTPDNLQLFSILTLIIIAMSVGSLAALSAFPKSYYLFVIPAMVPMIWRYFSIDEQNYIIFGALLVVFNFALFSIIRINHRLLRGSTILRFENIDLIDQLTAQKEKAEHANTAKTKFLAAASHDIRQPIHAIGLFLGILEESVEENSHKKIVHKIKKSSDDLNGLLDSLLDISKLDAGVIQIEKRHFFINDLIETFKNEFTHSAHEKGLKISFIKTRLCVDSDYQVVERLMRNLISNAIKYTNKGGIAVGCRRSKGQVVLAVYDTGIGINEDDIQVIFDEFHQLHNPERDRSKGLGLGLAIVKRMAKLLNASLLVKSVSGKGSTFGIAMQASASTVAVSLDSKVIENDTLVFEGKKILIVDDEEEIRDSLGELLRYWQCEVMICSSGAEAVQALQDVEIPPDLILADYRLRENETGIDVIQKINSLYAGLDVPAVIITGDTGPDRIKEAGGSGYSTLHKPVSPSELRLLLAKYLSEQV